MTPIVAHAGHWIANGLYAAPVVAIVIALMIQRRRDRREREAGGADEQPRSSSDGADPSDETAS